MPNHVPTPQPAKPELPKVGPRIWLWLIVGLISFGYLLAWLTPLAVRFPAASVPAILGAGFGFIRGRRRPQGETHRISNEIQMRIQSHTLVWGILSGAVGYASFAALRIGVPAPEAALAWRVFGGGAVFGAAAGAAAGAIVPLLGLIPSLVALIAARRRLKRAA